jgi:hypothetical protein
MKLFWALGGGEGHAVRVGETARALAALGERVRVIVPAGRRALVEAPGVECRELAATESTDELRSALAEEIRAAGASELVVDALPFGVLGELDPLPTGIVTTLLARLHRRADTAPFRRQVARFDRVFDLEPDLFWLHAADTSRSEPERFGAVARRPGPRAGGARPDVLVVAPDPRFVKIGRRLCGRGLRVFVATAGHVGELGHEPAPGRVDLGALAPRVLVGPAGYNLCYEALAAGVPHLAVPLPRRHDDQRRRARSVAEICASPEALEERAVALVESEAPRRSGAVVRAHPELAARLCGTSAAASARFSPSTMSQR